MVLSNYLGYVYERCYIHVFKEDKILNLHRIRFRTIDEISCMSFLCVCQFMVELVTQCLSCLGVWSPEKNKTKNNLDIQ